MHRYTEGDFAEFAEQMVDGIALQLTFDAGQQLSDAIGRLVDHRICVMSAEHQRKMGIAVSGVMGLPVDIVFMQGERFDVRRFSVIMAGLRASIVKVEFIDKDDAPTPARTDAFSTLSGAPNHAFR